MRISKKLTDADIAMAINLSSLGKWLHKEIAAAQGVTPIMISCGIERFIKRWTGKSTFGIYGSRKKEMAIDAVAEWLRAQTVKPRLRVLFRQT